MCRRVTCSACGRPAFAGCGRHIEQVLGDVAVAERCRCVQDAAPAPVKAKRSWFRSRS